MARYYQSPDQQYISQYTPTNIDYSPYLMAQEKERKQENNLNLLDDLSNKAAVRGGYRTQDRAKAFNQEISNQVAALSEDISKNPQDAHRKIISLRNRIQTNPEYQDIKADEAHTPFVDRLIQQPDFNSQVQHNDFYNQQQGFAQTKPGERFDPNKFYGTTAPGDIQSDFHKEFSSLVPIIEKQLNSKIGNSYVDAVGNLHTYNTQTGTIEKRLNKEDVKKILEPYIKSNPNLGGKQSLLYNKALHEKQYPGSKYDLNDATEDVTNAFLGTFNHKDEFDKTSSERISKPPKGTSGSDKDTLPNVYLQLVDPSSTTVTNEQLAPLFGNQDKDLGTYKIDIKGQPIDFAKTLNIPEEDNKLINYGIKLEKIKNEIKTGSKISERKSWSVDDENNLESNKQYQELLKEAQKEGVDLSQVEKYKDILGKDKVKAMEGLGHINEIPGRANFYVDPGTENKYNVDDKMFISGKALFTEAELNSKFTALGKGDSWFKTDWKDIYLDEDGSGFGLIVPTGELDKQGNQLYEIPIKKEVKISKGLHDEYNKNFYGQKLTGENLAQLQSQYNNYFGNKTQFNSSQVSIINQAISEIDNSSKSPEEKQQAKQILQQNLNKPDFIKNLQAHYGR